MNRNLMVGVALALLSTLLYSSLTALIKAGADTMPLSVVLFMQCATGLLVMTLLMFRQGMRSVRRIIKTKQLGLQFLRAATNMGVGYCMFSSVKYIPLVNAMLLSNTAPLIVPFVALIVFSQPINHRLWIPMIIGFLGVALVLNPDRSIFDTASFIALGSAGFIAITMLLVKKLLVTDSAETTTFYFFLFGTIIAGVFAFKYWMPLSLHVWLILSVISLMYVASQYTMTAALRYGSAQLISCMLYANIIFSMLISIIFWHTWPSLAIVAGMVLIVVGGIFCIRAEHLFEKRKVAIIV